MLILLILMCCLLLVSSEYIPLPQVIDQSASYDIASSGPVIISEYGIYPDTGDDVTYALQSLLSECSGRTVYVPSGTYVISNKINIPSGCTLQGESASGTVFLAAPGLPVGTTLFCVDGASNVNISNICIDGNSAINTAALGYDDMDGIHLLDMYQSRNVTITGCTFSHNIYAGIRNFGSSNICIDSCYFSSLDCGYISLGEYDNQALQVVNCTFDGHSTSEPIALYSTGSYSDIIIRNNQIRNKENAMGIYLSKKGTYQNVTICDNVISTTAVGICVANAYNATIERNSVSNTTSGGGIKLINCASTNVTGNQLSYIYQDGMYIEDCTQLVVNGNTLSTFALGSDDYVGIRITGAHCSAVSVSNNQVINTLSKPRLGIYVKKDTPITLINNNCQKCKVKLSSS